MSPRWPAFLAFALSGAAGLVYESVWSRYLSLLVGHSAYGQVLVISVFLGGMGLGALLVSRRTDDIRRPLLLYVAAEVALAVLALAFHPGYRGAVAGMEGAVLPALPGALSAGAVRWGLAMAMIAPQTILLGATFPLLAAGVVRRFPVRPGWAVAILYFLNSLGGAVGVLAAGFLLVPALGLPGALAVAAGLNLGAAVLVAAARALGRGREVPADAGASGPGRGSSEHAAAPPPVRRGGAAGGRRLRALLLAASFLTAVASFAYEIGWIRMLSLVLGSATHAFEIMLSAFVLGLALGGLAVRRHADAQVDPLRLLGWVQWFMGAAAVATLPVYALSFDVMGWMVRTLGGSAAGYPVFNVLRYGLSLAVMLPATVLAGMTLPLITGALVHAGAGERAYGRVYAANTLGSVVGVAAAGLLLLPALGLKGLLVAGAALDMALGAGLLLTARRPGWRTAGRDLVPVGGRRRAGWSGAGALAAGAAAVVVVGAGLRLDRSSLTSGVFRHGRVPGSGARTTLFYEDGRTATVGVHRWTESGLTVLTTNGKPDASLTRERLRGLKGPPEPVVLSQPDAATQLFSPLVALAHAPEAARVANIGHGSGISGHVLLGSPAVEELVTVEIEPAILRAARAFLPANRRVYDDPRSAFAVEDARTFFGRSRRPFDLILSEPSNPWVSGTSSLFTVEFYRRIRRSLADDGVLAQWIQLYEMSDRLVLTVLGAIHRVFPAYRAYLVGPRDLLVVATPAPTLPPPAWSVLEYPGVAADLAHIPELTGPDLDATRLFDRRALAPLLDGWTPVNSDFRPVLDYGAERARILGRYPTGVYRFATAPLDLAGALTGDRRPPAPHAPLSARDVQPMERRTDATALRLALAGTDSVPGPLPGGHVLRRARLRAFVGSLDRGGAPEAWSDWARELTWALDRIHGPVGGWVDRDFVEGVEAYLAARDSVPAPVRHRLALLVGARGWEVRAALPAAEAVREGRLTPMDADDASALLDAAALVLLRSGRPRDAGRVVERLAAPAGYGPDDARRLLLEAWSRRDADGPGDERRAGGFLPGPRTLSW